MRPVLRAIHIVAVFVLHTLLAFLHRRGLFMRHADTEMFLRWQGVWLTHRLVLLGPTFIKVGQTMATRPDLIPLEWIRELRKLQDRVPPFAGDEAMAIIERELGAAPDSLFAWISDEPVAAASLGQVYRARLHSGEDVAVKVQRPHVEEIVALDLAVLRRITRFLRRYPMLTRGIDWEGVIDEFEAVISEEMDYVREGLNAERFRNSFLTWEDVFIPEIYWDFVSKRVLTMDFVKGMNVLDIPAHINLGIDSRDVFRIIARTYFKQLLEDGYFHADPHPGNLRVMEDGRVAFFDFGMMGHVTGPLQEIMTDSFFHILEQDVHALTKDLIRLDFLPADIDVDRIAPVIERLFEDYLHIDLDGFHFQGLAYRLADIMYSYPFSIPVNFAYMIRTIMTLEGMGKIMDPYFSFFGIAVTYAEEFMLRREGRELRRRLFDVLFHRKNERIQWEKTWKLAKMAVKLHLARRHEWKLMHSVFRMLGGRK